MKFKEETFLGYIVPKIVLFNIAYISIIAILIFIKDKGESETTKIYLSNL